MHQNPKTITAAALAADALGLMNRFAITSLFVVDEGDSRSAFCTCTIACGPASHDPGAAVRQ